MARHYTKEICKKIAHQLSPVVTLAESSIIHADESAEMVDAETGETAESVESTAGHFKPGVLAEIERALSDHELIKIKVNFNDRDDRKAMLDELCETCSAQLVQTIGKMAVLLRLSSKPNPKLSNLERFRHIASA